MTAAFPHHSEMTPQSGRFRSSSFQCGRSSRTLSFRDWPTWAGVQTLAQSLFYAATVVLGMIGGVVAWISEASPLMIASAVMGFVAFGVVINALIPLGLLKWRELEGRSALGEKALADQAVKVADGYFRTDKLTNSIVFVGTSMKRQTLDAYIEMNVRAGGGIDLRRKPIRREMSLAPKEQFILPIVTMTPPFENRGWWARWGDPARESDGLAHGMVIQPTSAALVLSDGEADDLPPASGPQEAGIFRLMERRHGRRGDRQELPW